jgi:immune inhibitor A
MFVLLAAGQALIGAPAAPDPIQLRQPDGGMIEARVRGDEFFAWYETLDGHPIEQDAQSKAWIYRSRDEFRQPLAEPSARVVGEAPPPSTTWTPEEPPEAAQLRLQADQSRAQQLLKTGSTRTAMREAMSTPGPVEKKLLTICVRFSDSPPASSLTPISYFQEKIYGVTTGSVPKNTVADYYLEVSGGKLLLTGEAVGWINLPLTTADYGSPSATGGVHDQVRLRALVQNSVALLGQRDGGFDFGPYDADNDGFVDMLAIVFQGQGEADGGGPQTIWPHQSSYEDIWPNFTDGAPLDTGSTNAQGEKVYIGLYFTAAELNQSSADPSALVRAPIGTFCHEFAHALGLPDLYDRTAPRSAGLGNWSLMASGTYNQANGQAGDSPAWPDPYCRLLLGWDQAVNLTQNTIRARIPNASGNERTVHRLWTEGANGPQYFLAETRRRVGFDRGLPGEGLLIYHISVNDRTEDSQNDQQWYNHPEYSRTGFGHYLVALEQADGRFDLELTSGSGTANRGDIADPFTTATAFDDGSLPSSKAYPDWGEWGDGPSSHVAIRNIDTSDPAASYADLYVFQDQDRPLAIITSPADRGPVVGQLTEATGTAFDASGITGIRAWLYEAGPGGRYFDWTSSSWRSDFTEAAQKQLPPANEWTLAMPALPDGTYRLTVAAKDATGLESQWAVAEFTIAGELLDPTLTIDSPAGETYAEPPLIQGTASTPVQTTLTERRFALYSEEVGRWYNWNSDTFDSAGFVFADHLSSVTGSDSSWNFVLPSSLGNGRYQIHAQSANVAEQGRLGASPWVNALFSIVRTPAVSLTSISHQALLPSLGTLSGSAMPQGTYQLVELRIVIYRNGQYWNGATWTDSQTYVTAAVAPTGGTWTYTGTLPPEDGLYAVSVSAIDDQGSVSAAVAGGNIGQNNVIFRVDATPPSIAIQWPPVDYVETGPRIDASSITGTAVDGSGRPTVRIQLRRAGENILWSPIGWTADENDAWYQGAFSGDDGGSQVQWVMEADFPDVGANGSWCLVNGNYTLTVEATDVVGNTATAERSFTIDYTDPLLAGAVEAPRLPNQEPIGPEAANITFSPLATRTSTDPDRPEEVHSLSSIPGGSYGILASRSNPRLSYGYSTREPWLISIKDDGPLWQTPLTGSIAGPEDAIYERTGSPPVGSFGTDGSAVVASSLMQPNFTAANYQSLPFCEVARFDATGSFSWRRLVPTSANTTWQGYTTRSFVSPRRADVLPDGRTLLILELNAHDVRRYLGSGYTYQANFRTHVMVILLSSDGTALWTTRYGLEAEDERFHENETFRLLAEDGYGHLFLATHRGTLFGPQQVLRKIRLSDGLTVADHTIDYCESSEQWAALDVDATGRPILAGAMPFGQNDARLTVKRLSANELIPQWQTFGPEQSATFDGNWWTVAEVLQLGVDPQGITIVHNSPGENGTFGSNGSSGDSNDRILVSRFEAEGAHLWSRELNVPYSVSYTTGSRADFASITANGDVLLIGDFATGTSPFIRGYAKIAVNGDFQFFKDITHDFDWSYNASFQATLATNGDRLAAVSLNSDHTQLQLGLFANPANVVIAPALNFFYPEDAAAILGGTVTLEARNTGSLATFQWYRQAGDGSFDPLPGATGPRLTLSNLTASDAGGYRVVASNSEGVATSRTAILTLITDPPIITSSLTASAYTDEYFSYQITADNAPTTFSFVFDNDNYPYGLSTFGGESLSGFPSAAGTYEIQISATNVLGSDTKTLILNVEDRPVISLGDALDATSLAWSTAASPNEWRPYEFYRVVGTHAVVSNAAPGDSNWIEVALNGPGTLTFWWGAYISFGLTDRLAVYLDGIEQAFIGSSNYTQASLTIPDGSHTVRWALESGADGDYSTTGYLDGVSFVPSVGSAFDSWADQNGLNGQDAAPDATPRGDGIPNLLKYAFGMDPAIAHSGTARTLVPGTGTSGLPDIRPEDTGNDARLRVEFVRRKGTPGIQYAVQFSASLDSTAWQASSESPVVTSIDEEWERVVVQDGVSLQQARKRFARVEVTEAP